ncbi:preprotein translocase subunit SecY [Candidatus Schneideria nysicola]|uniref:preprotein translocase subunit SecY n=1 Tax=Candidatus Schneideria nysicola TaxID=1081631 RepID=UPI001CAA5C70|nr:preprotein translocase subunit SecY [Candidatus Schneideria nysicola]UAJ65472.1 preprotein translocase subunit SecY [Candidatus Schneideria nysicola]
MEKRKFGLNFQDSILKGMSELKPRILFVIIAIIIFRMGSFIPIPGIDTSVLDKVIEQQKGTIIEIFNIFSGGALSRASIFTLGIMPYISSSIIVQLLSVVHPTLSEIKKEGEFGRKKINQYTRYGTLILGTLQSTGIAIGLPHISGMQHLVLHPCFSFYCVAVISLVCGTMFLMWLGEQITEKGISNGISLIIFIGIIAGLPTAIIHTIEQARQGDIHFVILLLIMIVLFAVTFFVVFVEKGQRRITIHYARRYHGRRMHTSLHNSHLPLKVNMSGAIPAIFASSIILLPATLSSWFGGGIGWNWLKQCSLYLQPGKLCYIIIYGIAIIFFCFFYTSLVFNPRETAENLKKSGAFLPGMRPGEQTAKYIEKIMVRLTLVGAIYITFICLFPEFMRDVVSVPFYFGGTSLLIVVVVIIDFIAQIQTLIMSNQYDSILKKAKLRS